jgi:hypothetical protein
VNKVLTWFIGIWTAFAILVDVVSIIGIFGPENSFTYKLGFALVGAPILNFILQLVLFSPAIGAYFWLKHRRKMDDWRHPAQVAPSSAASDQTTEEPNEHRISLDYLLALVVLGTMAFWAAIPFVILAPFILKAAITNGLELRLVAIVVGTVVGSVIVCALHYWPVFVLVLLLWLMARPDENIQRDNWRVMGAWCFVTAVVASYFVAIGIIGDQGGWMTFGVVLTGMSSIATAIATIIGATVGDLLFRWYRMRKAAPP